MGDASNGSEDGKGINGTGLILARQAVLERNSLNANASIANEITGNDV
jgi:hypothetical protein